MVSARIKMNNHTNKVLNVIKAQFDLNDKSEALDKFAELCGDLFLNPNAKKSNSYDEFLHRVQQEKMKELWDNKEDEAWDSV